jgi:acyl-coenzyme A synthetase/AMP-(fatty) acid ligase
VAGAARALAGRLAALGVRRGDVVLTLVGTRPAWVVAMVACLRQGYVALPCTEQLRPRDLAGRLAAARPAAVVADERNAPVLRDAGWNGPTVWAAEVAAGGGARRGPRRPSSWGRWTRAW